MTFRFRLGQSLRQLSHLAEQGLESRAASDHPCKRWLSRVPQEYEGYYSSQAAQRSSIPKKPRAPVEPEAHAAAAGPSSTQPTKVWMFPWERRQIEGAGTPLRSWEKAYWGVFVTAIALFLFSRLRAPPVPKEDPQVAQQREEKKQIAARALLAGRSFNEGDDLFDGLSPREIQDYIAGATKGATSEDPYEGLSPEEINAYLAAQKG